MASVFRELCVFIYEEIVNTDVECERKEQETDINMLYVVRYRGNDGYLVHGM